MTIAFTLALNEPTGVGAFAAVIALVVVMLRRVWVDALRMTA